jgi:hypothetical protein
MDAGINQSTLRHIIQTSKLTQTSTATSMINYKYTNWDDPGDAVKNKQHLIDVYSDSSSSAPAVKLANLIAGQGISTFFYHIEKKCLQ